MSIGSLPTLNYSMRSSANFSFVYFTINNKSKDGLSKAKALVWEALQNYDPAPSEYIPVYAHYHTGGIESH